MAHLTKILEDQFNEAKKHFDCLQYDIPNTYKVEFEKKKFRIVVTEYYPRQAPEIFQNDDFTPIELPIIAGWKPFYQLYHIVKHLKAYSSIKEFIPFNNSVIPEIVESSPDIPSLNDLNIYFDKVDSFKGLNPVYNKAKDAKASNSKKSVESKVTQVLHLYEQASELSKEVYDLEKKIKFTKKDFYDFEDQRLSNEINQNNLLIDELVNTHQNLDEKKARTEFINQMLKLQANDAELTQRKNAIFDFNK